MSLTKNYNSNSGTKRWIGSVIFAVLNIVALVAFVWIIKTGFEPLTGHAATGIYKALNFRGTLKNSDSTAVSDGAYSMYFTIYDASTGGTCLYTARGTCGAPTAKSITVTSGVFSTLIGDTDNTDNPITIDFNSDTYWLGITVGVDAELTPRVRIGAAGYAFNADLLDGLNTSSNGGTTSYVPVANNYGNLMLTGDPRTSDVSSSTFYINPAVATSTYGLLGLAVGGVEKFRVDASGNVMASGTIYSAGVGTSTFAGGVSAAVLNITSASVTSTFANGIQIASGCYLMPDGSCAGAGSVSGWNDGGAEVYLTTGSDNVTIGASGNLGKLTVLGDTDEKQLVVKANATQNANIFEAQNSSGAPIAWINPSGGIGSSGTIYASGSGTSTFSNGATFATIGGNVGIGTSTPNSFFAVDGDAYFAEKVGIGMANPTWTFDVYKSQTVSNGTGPLDVSHLNTARIQLQATTGANVTYADVEGLYGVLNYTADHDTTGGYLVGTHGDIIVSGAGEIGPQMIAGLWGSATYSGTATSVDMLMGVRGENTVNSGSGIRNAAFYAATPEFNGGSITDNYGIYIQNQATIATNDYAIYSEGDTPSYFRGKIGINDPTPSVALSVNDPTGGRFGSSTKYVDIFTSGTDNDINSSHTLHFNFNNNQNVTVGALGSSKFAVGTGSPSSTIAVVATNPSIEIGNGSTSSTIYGLSTSTFPYGLNIATIGGNVGIGTSAPTAGLEVQRGDVLVRPDGTFSSGDVATLYLGDDGHYFRSTWGAGTQIGSFNGSGDPITFAFSSVSKAAFTNMGKLGVGTITPSSTLEVYNSSDWFGIGNGAATTSIRGSGTSTFPYGLNIAISGGNVGIGITNASNLLTLFDNAATSPLLAIGVGTATSTFAVGNRGAVTSTLYSDLSIVSRDLIMGGSSNTGWLYVGDGTATTSIRGGTAGSATSTFAGDVVVPNLYLGTIEFDEDGGVVPAMNIPIASAATGTVEGYTFDVDGLSTLFVGGTSDGLASVWNRRVGVNTISPSSTLEVLGTFSVGNGSSSATIYANTTSTFQYGLNVSTNGGTLAVNGQPVCLQNGTNCATTSTLVSGWTDGGAEVYLQTSTDNITIGASGNLGKLTVLGDTDEKQLVIKANATQNANIFEIQTSAGVPAAWITNSGNLGASGTLLVGTSGAQTSTSTFYGGVNLATSGGNVGIGTSAPTAGLEVQRGDVLVRPDGAFSSGDVATLYLGDDGHYFRSTWGAGTQIGSFNGSTDPITFAFSGVAKAGFTNTGKLGVGTITPSSTIEAFSTSTRPSISLGTGSVTSTLYADTTSTFPYGLNVATSGGTLAVNGQPVCLQNGVNCAATSTSVSGWTDGGTEIYLTTIGDSVGMGTTTPSAKLSIVGSVNQNPFFIASSTGVSILKVNSQGKMILGNPNNATLSNSDTARLIVADEDGLNSDIQIRTAGGNLGLLEFFASGGTLSSPTDMSDTQSLGGINFRGYLNGLFSQAAEIVATIDGTPGSYLPTKLSFFTSSDTEEHIERMTISPKGNLSIISTAAIATSTSVFAVNNGNVSSSSLMRINNAGDVIFGDDSFYYEASSTKAYITSLETGGMFFEDDAGVVSWADMSVTNASVTGTLNGYSASINGSPILTVWATSTGSGSGVSGYGIAVNTSSPSSSYNYKLLVDSGSGATGQGIGVVGTINASGLITQSTSLDLAESFAIEKGCAASSTCPMPADVVCISETHKETVYKCNSPYDKKAIGVVSTKPGFVLSGLETENDTVYIALAGRVPVNVSTVNGEIEAGDFLTASYAPGVAMKATSGGTAIGQALESYDGEGVGQILVLVGNSYSTPAPQLTFSTSTEQSATSTLSNLTELSIINDPSGIGPIVYGKGIDMASSSIINVASISGMENRWTIDEDGNLTTKGEIIKTIATSQGEKKFYPAYNTDPTIMLTGSGELINGEARIIFDPALSEIMDPNIPIKVSVTMTSEGAQGMYVAEKSIGDILVKEINAGKGAARFDYMIVALRKMSGSVNEGGTQVATQASSTTVAVNTPPSDPNFPNSLMPSTPTSTSADSGLASSTSTPTVAVETASSIPTVASQSDGSVSSSTPVSMEILSIPTNDASAPAITETASSTPVVVEIVQPAS